MSFGFVKDNYLSFASNESNLTSEQIEKMIALADFATASCVRTPGALMVVIDAVDGATSSTQNRVVVTERLRNINDLLIQIGFTRSEVFGKRTSLTALNERVSAGGNSTGQLLTSDIVAVQLVCQRRPK